MEKTPVRFLWHYIKLFKWYFFLIALCILFRQTVNAAEPYFFAQIFNIISQNGASSDWNSIFILAFIAAGLGIASGMVMAGADFLSARFIPKLKTIVVRDVFTDVNRQSISFFANEMTGNISNKVQLLASNTIDAFEYGGEIFHITSRLVASFVMLSLVSWYYTALLTVWIALITVASFGLGKIRHKVAKETGKQNSFANGIVVDALSNYSEIKSFANFNFEKYNLLKALRLLRRADTKEKKIMAWTRFCQQFLSACSFFGFLFFSILMFRHNLIDSTAFIFANTLFLGIAGTVFQFSWLYSRITRLAGNLASALETLAVEPEIADTPDAKKLLCKKAEIVLENVCFAYNRCQPLFKNLNLRIQPGEKVGLVGLSGSGKSTFIKLISRYYDINSGSIKINGQDIRKITQDSLHQNISAIPQDVCLFNRTLAENIRYGRPQASEKELIIAAKKAYADIFIKKSPSGYQTKVGDRGVILSGGERQRIAIARAILKNAPILIFDEATSALDSQSERHIQKSLSNLMKGKTVLAIAHRLSTLREMDRILVFDKGKIIEDGSPEELLQRKGMYHKFYTMQAEGFV